MKKNLNKSLLLGMLLACAVATRAEDNDGMDLPEGDTLIDPSMQDLDPSMQGQDPFGSDYMPADAGQMMAPEEGSYVDLDQSADQFGPEEGSYVDLDQSANQSSQGAIDYNATTWQGQDDMTDPNALSFGSGDIEPTDAPIEDVAMMAEEPAV